MEYTALQVAKHMIYRFEEKGQKISNLKLQKLLYFAWIDYYKKNKEFLFLQKFEAWKFGPVVPEVYYEFSDFGGLPIYLNIFDDYDSFLISDTNVAGILNETADRYLESSVYEMVSETHKEGGAWSMSYSQGFKNEIPFKLIIDKECCGE